MKRFTYIQVLRWIVPAVMGGTIIVRLRRLAIHISSIKHAHGLEQRAPIHQE